MSIGVVAAGIIWGFGLLFAFEHRYGEALCLGLLGVCILALDAWMRLPS